MIKWSFLIDQVGLFYGYLASVESEDLPKRYRSLKQWNIDYNFLICYRVASLWDYSTILNKSGDMICTITFVTVLTTSRETTMRHNKGLGTLTTYALETKNSYFQSFKLRDAKYWVLLWVFLVLTVQSSALLLSLLETNTRTRSMWVSTRATELDNRH